jgi:alkylation response protein AidB-like acyl-CoA dehydrogenase
MTRRWRRHAHKVFGVDHPAVNAAREIGESLLRPQAERVDVGGVPPSHIDALGAAGLLGLTAPVEAGGADVSLAVMRAVTEELAAADTSTWFVWTQHHTPVRTLARSPNGPLRDRLLPALAQRSLAGVAFTHLRRPGSPPVTATRTNSGWLISGSIAWLTSWQLADVFLVGAQCGGDVVWALLPLRDRPGVTARPLALAAMQGTSTMQVHLDALPVAEDEVVLVEDLATWRETDALRTADVSPSVFGVTREALSLLAERGPEAADLAGRFAAELAALRAGVDRLLEHEGSDDLEDRLRFRGQAHRLACSATAALVAAGGGRSMLMDQAAQRLARVALFLQVQGQTTAVRAAQLRGF